MNDALDEAKRLAELRIREQIEYRRKFFFQNALQLEAYGLEYSKQLTRAFTFSYFDLIAWLGMEELTAHELLGVTA